MLLRLLAIALLVVSAAFAPGAASKPHAIAAAIKVDLAKTHQVMAGFGSSERVWSDPHLSGAALTVVPLAAQNQILDLLIRKLGLTRFRPVLDPGFEAANDNDDPLVADRTKFRFDGKLADAHIALIKQAKPFGLRTFFPGPVYLENWMREDQPEEYVEWAMQMLLRWRALGAEPPYYAVLNEPQLARNFSPEWMRQVVISLGARMRAAGLKTKLVVPDDVGPVDAYRRAVVVLADPTARQYVGALAYHIYNGGPADWVRFKTLARRYRLPVWMTEYGNAAYSSWPGVLDWAVKMQTLVTQGDAAAVDYLFAFFGTWQSSDAPISMRFEDGIYQGFTTAPTYHVIGQFSRFVRSGDVRVNASSTDGELLVSAFKGKKRLVVVAVNTSTSGRRVAITVAGGGLKGQVSSMRTRSEESSRRLPRLAARARGFSADVPAASVTTFVVALS